MQYDPRVRFLEEHNGTLLFSGDNGIPLIRYHIADEGGLVPHDRMLDFLHEHGFHPRVEGPALPFAYVFGRSHFTVSYYGANIYPENIAIGLEQPEVSTMVTGKFVLEVAEDAERDRQPTVTVEPTPGLHDSDETAELIGLSIPTRLRRLNSEFANYVPSAKQPRVIRLREIGHPEYFPPGAKHRHTRA